MWQKILTNCRHVTFGEGKRERAKSLFTLAKTCSVQLSHSSICTICERIIYFMGKTMVIYNTKQYVSSKNIKFFSFFFKYKQWQNRVPRLLPDMHDACRFSVLLASQHYPLSLLNRSGVAWNKFTTYEYRICCNTGPRQVWCQEINLCDRVPSISMIFIPTKEIYVWAKYKLWSFYLSARWRWTSLCLKNLLQCSPDQSISAIAREPPWVAVLV